MRIGEHDIGFARPRELAPEFDRVANIELPHRFAVPSAPVDDFIARWQNSAAAERANYALFLTQLCDLLGVPQPEPMAGKREDRAHL